MKKHLALILIIVLTTTVFTGCLKKQATTTTKTESVELVMYGLFDDLDVYKPIIQEYQSQHSNVTITYKQFTDPEAYLDLIINELAEGEGPDIFAIHNSWIYEHYKKIAGFPVSEEGAQSYEDTFVSVVSDDFLRVDAAGNYGIYGMPMYVDTIGLYYNEDQLEDAIPSRGKPANTWSELKEDVFKLTKSDNSFERFEVAGVAMGRADNILRATDILYTLFLQYGAEFYNDDYTEFTITDAQVLGDLVQSPGEAALDLYTSFAVPSNENYSWNTYISDAESAEKELQPFIEGKVSMIFGYSYLYEDLLDLIDTSRKTGSDTIDPETIKITEVPQVYDPETSTEKRDVYASYFAYTVARTSENPVDAWEFIEYLTSFENQEYYFEETHRPSSRRDLIEAQIEDDTYGVFATQVGYAETIEIADAEKFTEAFEEAIEAVINTIKVKSALSIAEQKINAIMPEDGLFPEFFFGETEES